MVSSLVSRLVILVFGTLYPAYASYKAVKTKNVKEHVKWMMYWIVFALFTCVETITDVLFSWFPFYYEIKIIIVIWLLSPATRGSSILYRKFVHPTLASKEQEIDDYIAKAKERSYKQVLDLGSKGVNVLMQTAIKGGGGLVNQLRRSYSLSDLSGSPEDDVVVIKDETDMRLMKKKRTSPSRHSSESSSSLYFSEVDVRKNVVIGQVKSTDDISSGYSSGEVFGTQTVKMREGLTRSSSLSSPRPRSMRITRSTTAPKKTNTITESEDELFECKIEEKSSSSSDGEFKDCMEDETVHTQDQKVPSLPYKDLKLIENTDFRETSLCPQNSRLLEHKTELEKNTKQEEKRGGRYKKRVAPQPPPSQKGEGACFQVPVVTATLVLKPGEMRPLGPPSENSQTPSNIFVCHSPKARRRGHFENSTTSSRTKSPFNRLMPKKLLFWHHKSDTDLKGSPEEPKRCSWHERSHRFLAIHGLGHVKMLSKSDNNLKTNAFNSLSPFAEGTTGPLVTDSD